MSGLFVNAYDLEFSGEVTLWRFPRPEGADKREAEHAAGVSLWAGTDTSGPLALQPSEVTLARSRYPRLSRTG